MLRPWATKGCIPPNSETEQSASSTAPPFANIHCKKNKYAKKIKSKRHTIYCVIRKLTHQ